LECQGVCRITYYPDTVKALARMPADRSRLVRAKVAGVAADPLGPQPQLKPLKGRFAGLCRLRVGDWRAVLEIDRQARKIRVLDVKPMGGAYD
jgi:mRNA-degrading endonuclease RelE of RelBE toxin-antitoxin system